MGRLALATTAVVLLILTLLLFPPIATSGDLGICLPSPNQWPIPRIPGWLINTVLIILSAIIIAQTNKRYVFIQETGFVIPLALLILISCSCIPTAYISTSTLLLFCNVIGFFVIFSTYEERNATREFFLLGTLPAIGAMFQYAFIVMIPVYIGAGLLMKSFRLRELIAFVFGLAAPYWIAIGLGLVSPLAFRLPEPLIIFSREAVANDIFLTLVATGIMALLGCVFALYNGVRLFSRNSRLRCMHSAFNLMGFAALIAVIFDFTNFIAYFSTLALWVAIELATLLSLYNVRRRLLPLWLLLAAFLPIYILSIGSW